MRNTRPIWRSLRPVLLAAAAATSWLALSAPAATADTAPEPLTLVKSAGSSLVATTTSAADHTGSRLVQLKSEQPPSLSGSDPVTVFPAALPMLSPIVSDVTASADGLLHSVPAVISRSSADPAAILTDPAVALASAVADVASTAVLPVASTLTGVLDPVAKPIVDHGLRSVPSPLPGETAALPQVLLGGGTGPGGARSVLAASTQEETAPSSAHILADAESESTRTPVSSSEAGGAGGESVNRRPFQSPAAVAGSAAPEFPTEGGPDALFYPVPAVPGSGATGSGNSGGGPSVPGWLSNHHLMIPSTPASPVGGAALRAPAPVSFDPGSSPD